jgi:hypothetical protein
MKASLPFIIGVGLFIVPDGAEGRTKLHPVLGNIASTCRWQRACIARQEIAMRQALAFVGQRQTSVRKVELCNRNAARRGRGVDWVGFNNCIRNPKVKPRLRIL